MRHYAIDEWADFSRGLPDERERTELAAHLAGGCRECRSSWTFTAKLNATCASLAADPVPESTLSMARAIFRVQMGDGLGDLPRRGNRQAMTELGPNGRISRKQASAKHSTS